jgi:hypothetical protein
MTPQGNGEPIRYKVVLAGFAGEQLRMAHRQEAKAGRGQKLVAVLRRIVQHLQRDPISFGERLFRLPALHSVVYQAAIRPLVVNCSVHDDHPIVFIHGFSLLPAPQEP